MFYIKTKNSFSFKLLSERLLLCVIPGVLLIGLMLCTGCGGGNSVELGVNNSGTITSSDPSDEEWRYHKYVLDVEEGHPYTFTLTTNNGVTTGIWSEDKGSWIVEVSPVVQSRTGVYRFEKGGKQVLWVEAAETPAEYTWYVTR